MHFAEPIQWAIALLSATQIAAASLPIDSRPAEICTQKEKPPLLCYSAPNNTPQRLAITDIAKAAAYLRSLGTGPGGAIVDPSITMTTADAPNCTEWTLYSVDTASVLVKHIDSSVNSQVVIKDIANTIDGGYNATDEQKRGAIIGCGENGGEAGVRVDLTNPAYNYPEYREKGYTPNGVLVRVVANTNKSVATERTF
jgi:hypothetical protein